MSLSQKLRPVARRVVKRTPILRDLVLMKGYKKYNIPFFKMLYFALKGFDSFTTYCYQLTRKNYKEYISYVDGELPHKVNKFMSVISGDKFIFSEVVGKYIGVPENVGVFRCGHVLALNGSGVTDETLYDYLLENECISKPSGGANGAGVIIFENKDGVLNTQRGG